MERTAEGRGDLEGAEQSRAEQRGTNPVEEHGKLWAIATLLFVIAIIGYVLQA